MYLIHSRNLKYKMGRIITHGDLGSYDTLCSQYIAYVPAAYHKVNIFCYYYCNHYFA